MTSFHRIVRIAFGVLLLSGYTTIAKSAEVVRAIKAVVPQTPEDDAKIARHLKNIESKEFRVLRGAIGGLGRWQREDLSIVLEDRLRRNMTEERGWRGGFRCTGGENRVYLCIEPENLTFASALVSQGRMEAVPLLKQAIGYLMRQPVEERSSTHTRSMAANIYTLSLESVSYWDGKHAVLYEPTPVQEEEARMLVRPGIEPVGGLTATLTVPRNYQFLRPTTMMFVVGSKPIEMSLKLTNTTNRPIAVDLSHGSFAFSVVARGKRREISARQLAKPTRRDRTRAIRAGQSITLTWHSDEIKRLALHDVTSADFMIKAVYSPASKRLRPNWKKDQVVSNTLVRHYFSRL